MKKRPIIGFVLAALSLLACTFSVELLPTETPPAPTFTPMLPTATSTQSLSTFEAPSATPTLISIRDGTYFMLEVFDTFALSENVRSLAFSPDGSILAASGGNTEDFGTRLWDVPEREMIGTLGGHNGIVWGVAFSRDGERLATVSSDKTAKIWDWRNMNVVKSLDFPGQVVSVAFSPDGQSLAVGGVDEPVNQIRNAAIWTFEVGSWEPRLKFPEYWNITAMAYSPQGGTLVGGGTSRNVQVWRTDSSTPIFTLSHAHQVSGAAISPDGSTVATATCEADANGECSQGGIWLWDLPTGKLKLKLIGFPQTVVSVAYTADGSTLIAGSRDGTLRFYTTTDYSPMFELSVPGSLSAMTLSSDSGLLATGTESGEVNLWKVVYRP